jgi:hypothetical protein
MKLSGNELNLPNAWNILRENITEIIGCCAVTRTEEALNYSHEHTLAEKLVARTWATLFSEAT